VIRARRRATANPGPKSRGALGRLAEQAAARMLERRRLTVLARNWRGGGGELDLVALEGDTLVFVEVKARTGGFLAAGHEPVSTHQRRRIVRAARAFRAYFGVTDAPHRFDLVTAAIGSNLALAHCLRWRRDFIETRRHVAGARSVPFPAR